MGGAPPPPLDAAPQGAKNPEKFGPFGAGFGRFAAAEDHVRRGGEGGTSPLPDPATREAEGAPEGSADAVRGAVPPRPFWRAIERPGTGSGRSGGGKLAAASAVTSPGHLAQPGSRGPAPGQDLTVAGGDGRRFKRSVPPPFSAVGKPCSAWHPEQDDVGVTRPFARAKRGPSRGRQRMTGPIGRRSGDPRSSIRAVPLWHPL